VEQYLEWSGVQVANADEGDLAFYTDPGIKAMVSSHIETLIMRRNTVTGKLYRDDPAIMAWNLINEPRCKTEPSSIGKNALQNWLREMAAFVKALDENHLLTIGEEGFFPEGSPWHDDNPNSWSSDSGQDFLRNHDIPEIDFTTLHIWPDNWNARDWFLIDWIAAHVEAAELLRKPLIIQEFGTEVNRTEPSTAALDMEERESVFQQVYHAVEAYLATDSPLQGSLFWMWDIENPSEADTFGIVTEDENIMGMIADHVDFMKLVD